MKQTFILGTPDYYEAEMKQVDSAKAREQWQRLKNHIEAHDITVKVIPGSEKQKDSIYITDSAIIVNDFAIMARFHKVSRRGEEKLAADYLKNKLGLRIHYLPEEEGLYYEVEEIQNGHTTISTFGLDMEREDQPLKVLKQ